MSISGDQIIELISLIGHFPRLRKSHKLRFIEPGVDWGELILGIHASNAI